MITRQKAIAAAVVIAGTVAFALLGALLGIIVAEVTR